MRFAAAAIVVITGAIAVWGVALSVIGIPAVGIDADPPGGSVHDVLPGGPAWTDGVRVGDEVLDIQEDDGSGHGLIRTRHDSVVRVTPMAEHVARLRGLAMAATAGLVIVFLGLLSLARPPVAVGFASLGGFLGGAPVVMAAEPVSSTLAAVVVPALLGCSLVLIARGRIARSAGLALVALAAAWPIARFVVPALFDPAEVARLALTPAAAAAFLAWPLDLGAVRRSIETSGFPTRVDAISITAGAAAGLGMLYVTGSSLTVFLMIALSVVLYPRWRRAVSGALDRVLLGELRERSGLLAIEDERKRIARNLHDAPLQELAGVIKRLEGRSDAEAEVGALRSVATELRGITGDLMPGALQDLGLVPALEDLAAGASRIVSMTVVNDTAYSAQNRLPPEVELVIFRIISQAVQNALVHARESSITIRGRVSPDKVELAVEDTGTGISGAALRAAQRSGHFGLAVMRQRAALIDASLDISTGVHGTRVTVRWTRR